jgi:predicted nuclease of predicted toxin-antitoxin system
VEWSGEWSSDPGDQKIITYACKENRILVTLDKDFGELAIVYDIPHCGIIRLVNLSIKMQASVCSDIINRYGRELQRGGIITVEINRIRIRPASTES